MAILRHEHETESTDNGSTEQLIARGNLLLESLAREAHVARLEAKRAELELAMAEAKAGNPQRLTHWLQQHGGHTHAERNWSASTAIDPAAQSGSSQPTINPWHAFMPHARERLLARAAELKQTDRAPGTEPGTGLGEPPALATGAEEPLALATGVEANDSDNPDPLNNKGLMQPHAQPLRDPRLAPSAHFSSSEPSAPNVTDRKIPRNPDIPSTSTKPATNPSPLSHRPSNRPPSNRPPSNRPLSSVPRPPSSRPPSSVPRPSVAVIAQQFTQPDPATVESRYRTIKRIMASGMGLSVIFHVLVVIVLMIITIKLPQLPASLAFEASALAPVTETLEISQPAELSPLVEENVTEPNPMSPTPLDATMPSLNDLSLAPTMERPTNSVAQSLNSALAASSSLSAAAAINKASASFFGAAARGNSFCYVVDSSGSMRGGAWDAAKHELFRSLASLSEKQRFYIIFFAQEFHAIPAIGEREPSEYMLYANRENIDHARRWIDTIKIERGNPPNDALEFAIAREPDAIYLLTDGVTKVDVSSFLRRVNRTDDLINGERVKVPIHTIAFYSLDGQQLLRQIAAENQGQFIYVPDPRAK